MALEADAEKVLESFLKGEVNSGQLSKYQVHDVSEELLEDLLIVPLRSKYKSVWGSGRKRKNIRRVKKRAAYITREFVNYSCILQRLTADQKTALDKVTLATALNAVGCKAWPICFVD